MSPASNDRPTLLLALDEEQAALATRALGHGHRILVASEPAVAAARLAGERIDGLIVAAQLGDMTGLELLELARAVQPNLPAVLVGGASVSAGALDAALDLDVLDGYVDAARLASELAPVVARALARARETHLRAVEQAKLARRLETAAVLHEFAVAVGERGRQRDVLELMTATLERLVPFDAAAVLLACDGPDGRVDPVMHIHCRVPCDVRTLTAARDHCLERFEALAGRALGEGDLVVDVTGERLPLSVSLTAPRVVPLATAELPMRTSAEAHLDGVLHLLRFDASAPAEIREADLGVLAQLAALTCHAVERLSARLTDERRRMGLMVESMADGVIMTDEKGEVFLINPAARAMLGLPGDVQVTARYLKERLGFYPFDLVARAHAAREEVTVADKTLHSIVSPVRDAVGKRIGVVVVLRDISDWKQLETRKEEFVALVSHELRTPLTSISGALDILMQSHAGGLSDKQRRYLTMARDSSARLHDLIDDFLDAAHFKGGKLDMALEPLALDDLARDCVDRFRAAALDKHIDMQLRRDAGGGDGAIRILGDDDRLSQVLNNLLSNAVKFTPEGGRIEVEVFGPGVASTHVGVSVWNTGVAIPEDSRERVFDKFEQAGVSTTRRVGGTGLGLFISRSIVEGHGGRIWVEQAPVGTKFVLTLPAAAVEVSTHKVDVPLEGQPEPGGRQVLVVHEDRNAAYLLKGVLMAAGHRVHVVHDGDDALAWARERRPDLITVDARVAGVDGLALLAILKHDPDTRKAAVVVLSPDGDRDAAIAAGADAHFAKPVDVEAFSDTCGRLLAEKTRASTVKVLVVDDDAQIRMICREVLEHAGYVVREASDGRVALAEARRFRPDLVLLDVMMPDLDGFQTAKRLRADRDSAMMPIIFVSARGQTADKVRAFKLGAEDYLVKPFDSLELVARIEKALERRDRQLGASPTTRLPGARDIETEIERRLAGGGDFAFGYVDLDNLKAFNDYYGIAKADGVIRQTGDLLREVLSREGGAGDFLGHIAGDDFVFVTSLDRVDRIGRTLCATFDRLVPLYYNKGDRERGYIETADRYGDVRRFAIMSVSVAALCAGERDAPRFRNYAELTQAAAEAKGRAKAISGSSYVRDLQIVVPAPDRAASNG